VYGESGREAVIAFRGQIKEWYQHLLVGPVDVINNYASFALMPDGSKEGSSLSNEMDDVRIGFILLLQRLDADWAYVVLSDEEPMGTDDHEEDVPHIVASSARIKNPQD